MFEPLRFFYVAQRVRDDLGVAEQLWDRRAGFPCLGAQAFPRFGVLLAVQEVV